MSQSERERQLRWMMTLRVVTITTLLCCAFGVEFLLRSQAVRPLFLLSATAYGMVLLYSTAERWILSPARAAGAGFITAQLIGDALLITGFVLITGGASSPMSFLYLLPISVASSLFFRMGGLALAAVSFCLYAALVLLGATWPPFGALTPVRPETDPGRLFYLLFAHFVAMFAFAVLSSYLAQRVLVQTRELADRQRTVVRLKALNENIIESINSGLITTSAAGEINFMNRGGAEIIGWGQAEVEGQGIETLFQLGEGFLREARRRLLAQRRYRFERYFDTKEGRRIFLGIAISNLYDKTGRPLGYIFIFQDLTEIHAMEEEMRLQERMVALGEMAAGMAHELRNPLAAISGSVQYLKGDLRPQGETLELMDIILCESERLDQAIRDFLTFARPGRFNPEPIDMVRLLDEQIKLLSKSRSLRPDHRIETRFGEPTLECRVDVNRLRQVFWNLATNALKAMPAGGKLTISASRGAASELLVISFADEGVGMDERQRQQYFQPFSSSFDEGTGLGAAIVYRLVEEHRGRIQLDSAPGQGTRVTILLPDAAVTPAEPTLAAAGGVIA